MKLDRKSLNKLLSLNDRQLQTVIEQLIRDYGLNLASFHIKDGDMQGLRNALRNASDKDLEQLAQQFKSGGK